MSRIRVCFFGTPEFAALHLQELLRDDHYEVVGVVTQPDRPSGRKLQLTPSPVKVVALSHNLKVVAPESLKKSPLIVEAIKTWGAEIGIVVAFGQILSEEFMSIFPLGCVNVHASLLPRWRGAAPIQRAIEAGDLWTGVALQKMVKKLDAGDVIGERKISIGRSQDALEIHNELARLGCDLLHVELMDFIRGHLVPKPQDESLVTYAKKIEKSEAQIDWSNSALQIENKMKAFALGPGVYSLYNGKKIKVLRAQAVEENQKKSQIGHVVKVSDQSFTVQTGEGTLEVFEVQPESRNRMSSQDFIRGYQIKIGDVLC